MKRLPIIDIVRQAFALPFSRPLEFFKTIGLLLGVALLAFVLGAVVMMVMGVSGDSMLSIEQDVEKGDFSAIFGLMPLLLIVVFMMMMTTSYIFNFWVRAGAYGFDQARIKPFGTALSAAFVNGVKFLLIGILIIGVSFVIISMFSALGLTGGFGEQMLSAIDQDISKATRAGMLNQIISLVVGAGIYSFFSANLTQTALGSDEEGLNHPHTADFAVVLMLVYLVLLVPVTVTGLIGMKFTTSILNLVLGIFIMFAIGVAHGIRYRICRAEEQGDV